MVDCWLLSLSLSLSLSLLRARAFHVRRRFLALHFSLFIPTPIHHGDVEESGFYCMFSCFLSPLLFLLLPPPPLFPFLVLLPLNPKRISPSISIVALGRVRHSAVFLSGLSRPVTAVGNPRKNLWGRCEFSLFRISECWKFSRSPGRYLFFLLI